jgi:hypothetical protein
MMLSLRFDVLVACVANVVVDGRESGVLDEVLTMLHVL